MTRGRHLPALAALLGAVLLTGCGGGSGAAPATTPKAPATSATTGTRAGATSSQPASTRTSTSSTATSAGGGSFTTVPIPASPPANPLATVANCRREVASAANLITAAERAQLLSVCSAAGSGSRARLRAAERQVCLTVIKESAPGLAGPAITAAQQSCNKL